MNRSSKAPYCEERNMKGEKQRKYEERRYFLANASTRPVPKENKGENQRVRARNNSDP
jgi:hypothetical protein